MEVKEERWPERADGFASVLAIATATPLNIFYQNSFLCEKSEIEKRHLFLTEEILNKNPSICSHDEPSLNARQKLLEHEVALQGMEAAVKALAEWGQSKNNITHLIFCTTSSMTMPGEDYKLAKLLGLNPSINRFMLYLQGCFGGGTMLGLAKDLAENNKVAHVLCVCSELCTIFFRGITLSDPSSLFGPALFGDGAAAVVIGSDPVLGLERPLFELVWARQTFVPETDDFLTGDLLEDGLIFHVTKELPEVISSNIENCLMDTFRPIEITDWNSIFWVLHPGGPLVLRKIESKFNLNENKLRHTWKMLREYGNMSSPTVFFIMDELRRKTEEEGL